MADIKKEAENEQEKTHTEDYLKIHEQENPENNLPQENMRTEEKEKPEEDDTEDK